MKMTIHDFEHVKLDHRTYNPDKPEQEPEINEGTWVILSSEIEQKMPPSMTEDFIRWMSGQTVLSIGNLAGYFLDDVGRFLEGRGVVD